MADCPAPATSVPLRAERIVKSYGATRALRGVDFDVRAGAVNVLIGENGAGKSTLMRILAGVEQPDGGHLLLDGVPVAFASVRDAAKLGIGIVFQELNLCPNLSVVENIFLGRSIVRGLRLDQEAERLRAAAVLARLGAAIELDALVGDLRIGQQQIVEIARALAEDARILILDEPTSALSESEVSTLFQVIADLKQSGVGIVYISHRLEELMRIGDQITVMRRRGGGRFRARRRGLRAVDCQNRCWVRRACSPRGRTSGWWARRSSRSRACQSAVPTVFRSWIMCRSPCAPGKSSRSTACWAPGGRNCSNMFMGRDAGGGRPAERRARIDGLSIAGRIDRRLLAGA